MKRALNIFAIAITKLRCTPRRPSPCKAPLPGEATTKGPLRDAQDHYELQNYTTAALGAHAIRFGARLRAVRDANDSTSGFNGSYTYASLDSYAAGQPSQYEVTVGTPAAKRHYVRRGSFLPG